MSDYFGYLYIFESAVGLHRSRYSTLYVCCCCQPTPPCLLGGVRFCCVWLLVYKLQLTISNKYEVK